MFSRTEAGVIIAITGDCLTILLHAGNKKTVHVKNTTLTIGSKCQACFDSTTEKIVSILDYDDRASYATMIPTERGEFPTAEECLLLARDEERGYNKVKKFEDWESEELESWSKECSRSTES